MGSSTLRETTFLEAVTSAIQHEKDFFDFCLKTYETLPDGIIKDLFFDLAEDGEEHFQKIEEIYTQYEGNKSLPNLKYLGEVYKFQTTAIQKLMSRLDRNKNAEPQKEGFEALRRAQQEADDAADVFEKLTGKFTDPAIKTLFRQMAAFNRERSAMLEGCMVFYHPTADHDPSQDFFKASTEISPD
ncbi:MAG: hypothetical protein KDK38_15050 [Leptospiraceae bacterium]|nr:hypothetical protein [Leptospiraceae bacterium]